MYLKSDKARRLGFTLVEIVIVIVIFSIISAAALSTYLVGKRTWFIGSTQVSVQEAARNAIDRMARELIFSSPTQTDIGALGDTITFCKPENVDASGNIDWSEPIQYSLNAGQILRTIDSQTSILANNIQTLQFIALGSRGIEIRVTAQKYTVDGRNIEYSLNTQLYLRNE